MKSIIPNTGVSNPPISKPPPKRIKGLINQALYLPLKQTIINLKRLKILL